MLLAVVVGACGGDDDAAPDPNAPRISAETRPRGCPVEPPIECAFDVGERLPLVVTGTTRGREDGYGGSRCGVGGGDAVEDIAFRWTAPADGTYRISTEGSAYDTVLSLRMGSCAGRELACNDDAAPGVTHSFLSADLPACRTVTIVVDASTIVVGDFRLTVHGRELVCDDGVDDDGDGAADCADDDCFGRVCPGEDRWPAAWAALEWDAHARINAERARGATCGGVEYPPVPPLEVNRQLRDAARLHSQDMTDNDYFSHDSLDGRMLTDRVAAAGYAGAGPLGENILSGSSDAAEAVAGWMASEGHCTNIMNPSYHVAGIGYADGAGGPRWTQDFGGG